MTFVDGNSALLYHGNSYIAAMYYYIVNTVMVTEGAIFVSLEVDLTVK